MSTALELRTLVEMTQVQAAKVLDVSVRTWKAWEAETPPMPLKKAQAFKDALAAPAPPSTVDELFEALCASGRAKPLPACLHRVQQTPAVHLKPMSRTPQPDDDEPIVLNPNDVTAADLDKLKADLALLDRKADQTKAAMT